MKVMKKLKKEYGNAGKLAVEQSSNGTIRLRMINQKSEVV
jgi:hypothetical protein